MSIDAPAISPAKQRFNRIKPYLAPFLITTILVAGQYHYGILEGHWGTAIAIVFSIALELTIGKLVTGRWPHLASAYITGISVGILVRSQELWPYFVCSGLSITSKFALRVKGRHLWNPSNLGVSVLLFLVPAAVVPLSLHWGNDIWVPMIILCLGSLILFTLGRLHITATYAAAFTLLSLLRSSLENRPIMSELGLLTSPSYLLFMFFMITDPKTTPRTWPRQIAVTLAVAVVETILRLFGEWHAPYYALFIVFPIANLLEIWWESRQAKQPTEEQPAGEVAASRAP